MRYMKKLFWPALIGIFFLFVFLINIKPLLNFDLWFHLKAGEVFSKMGIIHYDIFSYTAYGREWFPYEWFFQILIYQIDKFFGLVGIQLFVAGMATFQLIILYIVLKKIFHLSTLLSFFVCLFFLGSVYEFFVARPFIIAYPLLTINLFLLFLYFFQNKNSLWLSLPITLIWANLHGSIFLDIFFFAAYTCLAGVNY